MTTISYAQNYEDVMLARALADVERGFYVDVGAQHPINGSVTKAFAVRGWHGINIEPVERWFRLVCDDRPEDVNLCVPIAEKAGFLDLFDVEDTGLSTTRNDYASAHSSSGWNVVARRLKAHTLNAVFRAHVVDEVHFLKVDVEGAEESVLRSLDFRKYRPWIVLVEATKPNSPEPSFENWEPILLEADYDFVYDDGLNRFYLAREHRDRAKHFTRPPNFFDHFVPYSEWWAREQMERLDREVQVERDRTRHGGELLAAERVAFEQSLATGLHSLTDTILQTVNARLDRVQRDQADLARRLVGDVQSDVAGPGSLEQRLTSMEARLDFSDNVQRAFLASVERERASVERERLAEAQYQRVLRSRSWRATAVFRFAHRALVRVPKSRPTRAELRSLLRRVLMRVLAHPWIRRIGVLGLRLMPRLKARLVRIVVEQPPPGNLRMVPEHFDGKGGPLSRRASSIREMIDRTSGAP